MKKVLLLLFVLSSCAIMAQDKAHFIVHFDHDKSNVRDSEKTIIDSCIALTQVNFIAYSIELHGHCDYTGSDSYNDNLSIQRVQAVKDFLVQHKIPASAIQVMTGHGEHEPVSDNETEGGRQDNRRVEIILNSFKLVPVGTEKTIMEKISDSSTVVGTNIVLRNINFVGGRHQLLFESFPMLEELLSAMQSYPTLVIEIQGHICCQPGNQDGTDQDTGLPNLSEARSKAIRDYLVNKGIASERITWKGFGHSQPLYAFPEKSEEERTSNRRVEIKIIRK
jgi:outer membrane protein OmpA-like peptidoglycan-associated protein